MQYNNAAIYLCSITMLPFNCAVGYNVDVALCNTVLPFTRAEQKKYEWVCERIIVEDGCMLCQYPPPPPHQKKKKRRRRKKCCCLTVQYNNVAVYPCSITLLLFAHAVGYNADVALCNTMLPFTRAIGYNVDVALCSALAVPVHELWEAGELRRI